MEPFHVIAILLTLAAAFAYVNHLFIRMPMTIGLMMMSMGISVMLIFAERFGMPVRIYADMLVGSIDFETVLMDGMLGLLLFAGALHINFNDLDEQKLTIGTFATFGVLASTFLVGAAVYSLSSILQLNLRFIECLLFGALISPTDPIAVLGILKKAGAPKRLETKIAGESLFNDGFGVVVFLVLLEFADGSNNITASHVLTLLTIEVLGGIIFGLFAGYSAYRVLKSLNNYQVEVLITLALVFGAYALGAVLHISAPIAIVVAGLLIGNHGRQFAMSDVTREHLDTFWELIDEILNAVLFVLIGLEVLVLTLQEKYLLAGAAAVPLILISRLISLWIPTRLLSRWHPFSLASVGIMTWGGLRGGISVAMALSLPEAYHRELILTMTYVVVVFSVLVQGLTIKPVMERYSTPQTSRK